MIIIAFPSGNHSNRLFQNLHFEAFCKEYNIDYINPTFLDMYKYYMSPCKLNKGLKGRFVTKNNLFLRVLRKTKIFNNRNNIISFDNDDANSENVEKNILKLLYYAELGNVYVGGYYFRVNKIAAKYQDYFIKNYTLKNEYIADNKLLILINKLKLELFVIVGIHIRRGDYKFWRDGKYYFDDSLYDYYMTCMSNEIKRIYNRKCLFIIFSNETISINENDYIIKSDNEWYVDQFIMSKCDYLIGPPSSFTLWASYIGKVKLFTIKNINCNFSLDNFLVCNGFC